MNKLVELFARICDVATSLFGEKPEILNETPPPRTPSKDRPEEVTLILSDTEGYRDAFREKFQKYRDRMKEIRDERFAQGSFERQSEIPDLAKYLCESEKEIRRRIETQTHYEFMMLVYLHCDLIRGEKYLALKKYKTEIREREDIFEPEIYRDACREILSLYGEITLARTMKTGT